MDKMMDEELELAFHEGLLTMMEMAVFCGELFALEV